MKLRMRGMASPIMALATLLSMLGAGEGAAQEVRACSVSAVQGAPARARVSGRWHDLAVGPLARGAALIATGPGARVEIRCDDGLVLTLGAGIEVELEGLIGAAGPAEASGFAFCAASSGSRRRTGAGSPSRCGRRSRSRRPGPPTWLVEYAEATGTGVFVRLGSVDVAAARGGATARLDAGEGVTIVPGAARVQVVRWGEGRIAGAGATLGFGWQ